MSMEKRIRLLILNEKTGGDGIERLRESLSEKGVTVSTVRVFGEKKELSGYLAESRGETFVLIAFLRLQKETVTVEDLKGFQRRLGRGSLLIPVAIGEEKGGGLLRELFREGFYDAVFPGKGKSLTVGDLSQRILHPRTKEEAERDFDLKGEESAYYAASYLLKYDGTQEDLVRRLSEVEKRDAGILPDVLSRLPEEMLRKLSGVEGYDGLVNKELAGRKNGEKGLKVPDHLKRLSDSLHLEKGKKKTRQLPGEKGEEIAFISANRGVGCTYNAIMCAYSLSENGRRTAVVELDSLDGNFSCLCKKVRGTPDVGRCTSFSFGSVDFYFGTPLSSFREKKRREYDTVIYDLGCCKREAAGWAARNCRKVFFVAGAALYKREELKDLSEDVRGEDPRERFVFLLTPGTGRDVSSVLSEMPDLKVSAVPYSENPFCPERRVRRLYRELSENGVRPPGRFLHFPGMEKRLRRSYEKRLLPFLTGAIPAFLLSFFIALTLLHAKKLERDELLRSFTEELAAGKEREEALAGEISGLEEKLSSLEQTVTVLNRPAVLGERITEDMVREEVIFSSLPKGLCLQKEDVIGKVAASNIVEDVPLYESHVAEFVKEPMPFFETDPGGE